MIERFVDAVRRRSRAPIALVALTDTKMIGCRDPLGIRPLVIGDFEGSFILASETCALDIIGARYVRDVEPGELVIISDDGLEIAAPVRTTRRRASASSSTSTSRGPIRPSTAATSTTCGSASAPSSPARRPPTPTSWCRCPIPAPPPRSAMPRPPACRSSSASSATTMSAAPSSSRPTRSATWASS